ncbi:hypothetical protein Cs7R123_76150 [Catellatospora sp. TT07R-123]|nr:hypothetical protein Cs7R123_76150 [Catellatospora sp. TT07R-123]
MKIAASGPIATCDRARQGDVGAGAMGRGDVGAGGLDQVPKRRWRPAYARRARRKSTWRKSGQLSSQK